MPEEIEGASAKVRCPSPSPKGGLIHSRYQEQKSSQIREYNVLSASLNLNSLKSVSIVTRASRMRLSIQETAKGAARAFRSLT